MNIKILILVLSFCSISLLAQDINSDKAAKKEIKELGFLVGEWEGEGWLLGRDQQKHFFQQTENINFKIDSVAILIEGLGKTNDKITHNALAIITYNKKDSNYTFQSYTSSGRGGSFTGKLDEGKFYWYPNQKMRYIIWINEKGQWYETGEYKKGEEWKQFFEMTLNKKQN